MGVGVHLPPEDICLGSIDRTAQPIFVRFKAFDAQIYPRPEVCQQEVPALITFQHGVEYRKWCDFHHYTMLADMCARQLVQGSTVFISADQPETSR